MTYDSRNRKSDITLLEVVSSNVALSKVDEYKIIDSYENDTFRISSNNVYNFKGKTLPYTKRLVFIAVKSGVSITIKNLELERTQGISIIGFSGGKLEALNFKGPLNGGALAIIKCRNLSIKNINILGGNTTSGKIAILLYLSSNIKVSNCTISGGDWYVAGVQVKGGKNNSIDKVDLRDIHFAKRGFYIRGDNPWRDTVASVHSYNYLIPWHALESLTSERVVVSNCNISNSSRGAFPAILIQEAKSVEVRNCTVKNSFLSAVTIKQLVPNGERDITISGNRFILDSQIKKSIAVLIARYESEPIRGLVVRNNLISGYDYSTKQLTVPAYFVKSRM